MPVSYTSRGFAVYADIDTDYGHAITVHESSAASEPKCWLSVGASTQVPGSSAHLTVGQATAVRDALNEFITGATATDVPTEPAGLRAWLVRNRRALLSILNDFALTAAWFALGIYLGLHLHT